MQFRLKSTILKSTHFTFRSSYSTSKLRTFSDRIETAVVYHCVTVSFNFFYINDSIKIITDIISEDIKLLRSYMCSLDEILCVLEEEIVLVCWQLPHDIHATEIF